MLEITKFTQAFERHWQALSILLLLSLNPLNISSTLLPFSPVPLLSLTELTFYVSHHTDGRFWHLHLGGGRAKVSEGGLVFGKILSLICTNMQLLT